MQAVLREEHCETPTLDIYQQPTTDSICECAVIAPTPPPPPPPQAPPPPPPCMTTVSCPRPYFAVAGWERLVVKDGVTFDDWSPEYVGEVFSAVVDGSEDRTSFFISLDESPEETTVEEDWSDWIDTDDSPSAGVGSQAFQHPLIASSDPITCNPSVSGPASNGGTVSGSGDIRLDVHYNCLCTGPETATITVTIPLTGYADVVYAWTKQCSPPQPPPSTPLAAVPAGSIGTTEDEDEEASSGAGTAAVFIGIILGCVLGPLAVKQCTIEQNKAAARSAGGGGGRDNHFSSLNVETLPLTQQQAHSARQQHQADADRTELLTGRRSAVGTTAEGNPLLNAQASPPRPSPADAFVSHHYNVLAPAVVRVGGTKFGVVIGNLTVGERIIGIEERVDNAGVHRVRFTRVVQQQESFQEGWTEVLDPTTGAVQLQRADLVNSAQARAAELTKVQALLAKHNLQAYEAPLKEMGASSPIHLAQLRPDDLHTLELGEQAKRSFEALSRDLHAVQPPWVQPAPPSPAPSAGYTAFSTPEPGRRQQLLPVAQVTPVVDTAALMAAAAAASSPEAVRPPGTATDWETKKDPVSGKAFYFNLKTNERSFAIPAVLQAAAATAAQAHAVPVVVPASTQHAAPVRPVRPAQTAAPVAAQQYQQPRVAATAAHMAATAAEMAAASPLTLEAAEGGSPNTTPLSHADPFGEDEDEEIFAPAPQQLRVPEPEPEPEPELARSTTGARKFGLSERAPIASTLEEASPEPVQSKPGDFFRSLEKKGATTSQRRGGSPRGTAAAPAPAPEQAEAKLWS